MHTIDFIVEEKFVILRVLALNETIYYKIEDKVAFTESILTAIAQIDGVILYKGPSRLRIADIISRRSFRSSGFLDL